MAGKHPKRKERPGVDRLGRTELHYVANENELEKARHLIAAGAGVDLPDDNGWTPLHFAAQSQSLPIAEVLLAAGAPVDVQDSDGNTPLSTAGFQLARERQTYYAAAPLWSRPIPRELPWSVAAQFSSQHWEL
jgi:ankyrin repeat protein